MGQIFGCIQVEQSKVAVKEQVGKFIDVLEPGLDQDQGQVSTLEENVFVNVVASVQYAFYKLFNAETQIQTYVFNIIRAIVPKLDDVFEKKSHLAKVVEDELNKAMSTYGFEIVQTLIVDIEPDVHVKRSMNEINAESEKAEAEKILQIKRAKGEAESQVPVGAWNRQHQAILDGLRNSVLDFSDKVPEKLAEFPCMVP